MSSSGARGGGLVVTGALAAGKIPKVQVDGTTLAWDDDNDSGGGLVVTGAPAVGKIPKVQGDGTTVAWDDDNDSGAGSGVPWVVKPASGATDIGPLIQAALDTYGVAWVAAGAWTINTQVTIDDGQSIIGQGQGSTRLTIGAALNGQPVIVLHDGTSSHFTIQGIEINCQSGANVATYGLYLYATAAPTAPDISPDYVATIRDVSVYNASQDGFFVGGTYSGGLRETRFINCLSKHNGQWGFNIQSSDCFLSDCTTHGNGSGFGGFHLENGSAGNAKLVNCKAYYEDTGYDAGAVRCSWFGGEIQDCRRAAQLAANNHLVTTVDSCGDGGTTYGAVRVSGTGCKLDLMFVGRTKPSGANGQAAGSRALEMQFGASVLHANLMVQAFGGGNDYSTNLYQGANRPAAGSVVTFAPSTMTT